MLARCKTATLTAADRRRWSGAVAPPSKPSVPVHQQQQLGERQGRNVVCNATVDDPELVDLVQQLQSRRPPPPEKRDKLRSVLAKIDEINSKDPNKVNWEGMTYPYRTLYGNWVAEWVQKLDPKAPDELLIMAKGRSVEGWRLTEIKRDDYAPNSGGERQWSLERKRWQADRLLGLMKEAGYEEATLKFVEDIMMDRNGSIPDPRDIRRYDLIGAFGAVNFRLLEQALVIQTLRDAEALVFMERNFPQMFDRMKADEVLESVKKELSKVSEKCITTLLAMKWTPVQRKLLQKAWTPPKRFGTIMNRIDAMAAASTHPGDWRFQNFDYD